MAQQTLAERQALAAHRANYEQLNADALAVEAERQAALLEFAALPPDEKAGLTDLAGRAIRAKIGTTPPENKGVVIVKAAPKKTAIRPGKVEPKRVVAPKKVKPKAAPKKPKKKARR